MACGSPRPGRLGGSGRSGLWARRVGWGLSHRSGGVGGPGGVGPSGCWAMPGSRLALPCPFAGQSGRRPRAASCGTGPWAEAGHGYRRVPCPAAGPEGWTAGHKRAAGASGGRWDPGYRTDSRRRGRLRPAALAFGRALAAAIHVWAHRSGWRAELTSGRPLRSPAAAGRDTTRQPSLRPRWSNAFPGRQVRPRSLTEAVTGRFLRPFPAHPGAGNVPRASPTGPCRVGLAAPVTRPPLHPARPTAPIGGKRLHPRGLQRRTPTPVYTNRRDLLHPPRSPGSPTRISAKPTTRSWSAPTTPSRTTHPHPKHPPHKH